MYTQKKGINIRLTSIQMIVLFYVGAVIISTILFSLPIALKPGVNLSLLDTIFTAVSAISVTGLTVVSTADTFSVPGTFILAFVLQFGGIGIMTLGTFIWLLLGKKIGLRERQLIMTDQNRGTFAGLVQLMKEILKLILLIEFIGAVILGLYFLTYFPTWQEAFLQGFFASVSATTNAGFDITGQSLIPFANDYFVQTVNIILLILGAIGFPVLMEVKDFIKTRKEKKKFYFSLFTKLTTITFFSLTIVGMLLILLFDWSGFLGDKTWHEKFFYSLFQSVTTRNGGLATMDVSEFSTATQLVLSALMFIGASPSSVGGGIRTTTFAIALLAIFSYSRGKKSVKVFRRELDPEDIIKSFVVICVAVFICGLAVVILSAYEPFPLMHIIFEVASAFGTTGLSMGITPELSDVGKQVIIVLMFIGRIGIFSFLYIVRGKEAHDHFHYPKEKVIIG
ncbi:TrkH family potassium uptake protein [Anaerobacillus alkaliphilus]|uniref:TrkH family potassium uptake protein n=1 Tax=Anaerobacillus alkaliphilus TaxID=1548597 RepID=A0A4Q0VNL2_9BACI|nr:TrkH family potassium uptake protein [Anaerobacillus alkaliphilus]RXI96422.1 TrkH family potassium uptake protein [Anaerobacillus alkaliphilus]